MQARLISISKSALILEECHSLSLTLNYEDAEFRNTVKARGYKWDGASKCWTVSKINVPTELNFLLSNNCRIWGRATDVAEVAVRLGFKSIPAAVLPGNVRESDEWQISEQVKLDGAPAWVGVTLTPNAKVIRERYF